MSAAYFIVLDKKKPGFDLFVNGKFLAQDAKRLARVAKGLELPDLDTFVSYSPEEARGMIDDMGGDPDEVELPDEHWFTAAEGLAWTAKMTEYIRANPSAVKNAKGVLSDLEEYKQVLGKAKAAKARWHLQVDA